MRTITVTVEVDDKLCDRASSLDVLVADVWAEFLEGEGIEYLEEYLEDKEDD